MIARGSQDELELGRHIRMWNALLGPWNEDADRIRNAARGRSPAAAHLPDDVAELREAIAQTLDLAERWHDALPSGHASRRDLLRIISACEALLASLSDSLDRLEPRLKVMEETARLRFLVAALRTDAAQAARRQ